MSPSSSPQTDTLQDRGYGSSVLLGVPEPAKAGPYLPTLEVRTPKLTEPHTIAQHI